ncbi:hypothetical protein K440DRAFT_183667 [Wilcoxina mikolae CBS 423.85]|nr:hypothetical protein K440DRAFT_183667 [Wilcoxina mikolae CBS 423.85]
MRNINVSCVFVGVVGVWVAMGVRSAREGVGKEEVARRRTESTALGLRMAWLAHCFVPSPLNIISLHPASAENPLCFGQPPLRSPSQETELK